MDRTELHYCFGGQQEVWKHKSSVLGCEMKFGIYLPEAAVKGKAVPTLYWLSGLTCTEQNFITKAGAQALASQFGIAVVAPDTSPRGPEVADDAEYDLRASTCMLASALGPAISKCKITWLESYPRLSSKHFRYLAPEVSLGTPWVGMAHS